MPKQQKDKDHNDIIAMFIKYSKINPDYYKPKIINRVNQSKQVITTCNNEKL